MGDFSGISACKKVLDDGGIDRLERAEARDELLCNGAGNDGIRTGGRGIGIVIWLHGLDDIGHAGIIHGAKERDGRSMILRLIACNEHLPIERGDIGIVHVDIADVIKTAADAIHGRQIGL